MESADESFLTLMFWINSAGDNRKSAREKPAEAAGYLDLAEQRSEMAQAALDDWWLDVGASFPIRRR